MGTEGTPRPSHRLKGKAFPAGEARSTVVNAWLVLACHYRRLSHHCSFVLLPFKLPFLVLASLLYEASHLSLKLEVLWFFVVRRAFSASRAEARL